MNKEEIIRMAREAGATPYTNRHYPDRPTHTFNPEQIERFAALVAAAEREACEKECDELAEMLFGHGDKSGAEIAVSLRDTIRARGQA